MPRTAQSERRGWRRLLGAARSLAGGGPRPGVSARMRRLPPRAGIERRRPGLPAMPIATGRHRRLPTLWCRLRRRYRRWLPAVPARALPLRRCRPPRLVCRRAAKRRAGDQAAPATRAGDRAGRPVDRRAAGTAGKLCRRRGRAGADALVAAAVARRKQSGNDCRTADPQPGRAAGGPFASSPPPHGAAGQFATNAAGAKRAWRLSIRSARRLARSATAVGRRHHDHRRHGERSGTGSSTGRGGGRRGGRVGACRRIGLSWNRRSSRGGPARFLRSRHQLPRGGLPTLAKP